MDPAVRCPMCAEEIGADVTVCPSCGTRLIVSFQGYCTACHAVVETDAGGLCRRCGGPVADLQAVVRPAEEAKAPVAPAASPPPPPSTAWGASPSSAPPAPPTAALGAPVPQAPEPAPSRAWWERGRAATRPVAAPRRSNPLVMAVVAVAAVLVVAGLGIGLLFLATGGIEMLKPPVAVTFATIGQYPEERRVILEGRLRLPGSLHCDENCGVYLVDPASSDREIPLFIDVAEYSKTAAPNQMERLHDQYTTGDFRVHLDDGSWVGDGALVRVMGGICRTEEKEDVCLRAQLIEPGGG